MKIKYLFGCVSIVLAVVSSTACANLLATHPSPATGAELLPPNWTCSKRCQPYTPAPGFPMPRHGLFAVGGLLDGQDWHVVDYDSGTLSVLTTEIRAGQVMVIERHDIVLTADQLTQVRKIADSIWASIYPVPTDQVALDGYWSVRLIDGPVIRDESGMGNPGGAARELNSKLSSIEEPQLPQILTFGRRWYKLWSCYSFPGEGQTTLPSPHIRPAQSWEESGDVVPSFPAIDTLSRFHNPGRRWTCADW